MVPPPLPPPAVSVDSRRWAQVAGLEAALAAAGEERARLGEGAGRVSELERAVRDLERANRRLTEAAAAAAVGPSPEEFRAAIEAYKAQNLMTTISERVFVHVVAPRTILQVRLRHTTTTTITTTITTTNYEEHYHHHHRRHHFHYHHHNNQVGGAEHEFRPAVPSNAKVQDFIRRELEPHFEMVFKTLAAGAPAAPGAGAPPRMTVEGQRAPDGTSVRAYADKFNSTLANFVKKCLTDTTA